MDLARTAEFFAAALLPIFHFHDNSLADSDPVTRQGRP
jgi:hypothetical protein